MASEYTLGQELGSGAFGTVYKASRVCALKAIDISAVRDHERAAKKQEWKQEVEALMQVRGHENVVEYRNNFASVDNKLWVEMEYCNGGTLNDYVIEKNPGRVVKHRLMVEISSGIAFLHANNVIHRDLKPENIMISIDDEEQPHAKVGDFGLAKMLADCNFGGEVLQYYLTTGCGTEYFMAPEVYEGHYTEKADIFSTGMIYYTMVPKVTYKIINSKKYLLRRFKNYEGHQGEITYGRQMLESGHGFVFCPVYEGQMSKEALTLLDSMIHYKPKCRPSAEEVTTKLRHISPTALSMLAPAPAASP